MVNGLTVRPMLSHAVAWLLFPHYCMACGEFLVIDTALNLHKTLVVVADQSWHQSVSHQDCEVLIVIFSFSGCVLSVTAVCGFIHYCGQKRRFEMMAQSLVIIHLAIKHSLWSNNLCVSLPCVLSVVVV